mgnify:CR=1 FL=1
MEEILLNYRSGAIQTDPDPKSCFTGPAEFGDMSKSKI